MYSKDFIYTCLPAYRNHDKLKDIHTLLFKSERIEEEVVEEALTRKQTTDPRRPSNNKMSNAKALTRYIDCPRCVCVLKSVNSEILFFDV